MSRKRLSNAEFAALLLKQHEQAAVAQQPSPELKAIAAEVLPAPVNAPPVQQSTVTPQPAQVPGAFRGQTNLDGDKIAALSQKRTRQRDKILDLLLTGALVKRDGSGKLYGIRNVGECVRQIRKDHGHDAVRNKNVATASGEEIFDGYYMPAETIVKVRSQPGRRS